ncbi:MAG: hypothetical protein AAF719_14925 [Pseudomonadota bacterium]
MSDELHQRARYRECSDIARKLGDLANELNRIEDKASGLKSQIEAVRREMYKSLNNAMISLLTSAIPPIVRLGTAAGKAQRAANKFKNKSQRGSDSDDIVAFVATVFPIINFVRELKNADDRSDEMRKLLRELEELERTLTSLASKIERLIQDYRNKGCDRHLSRPPANPNRLPTAPSGPMIV